MKRSDLHEYQERMVKFITLKSKVALFADMGLGKSVTALTAVVDLNPKRVLIVAPLRVCNSVWRQEVEQWEHLQHLTVEVATGSAQKRLSALRSNSDIVVINRENVVWMTENYQGKFDMLIVDESSSFKSAKAQRFRALKTVDTKYTVLLTGTPTPQSLMDLWSQMFLLDRGARLGRTITAFRNRFFRMGGFGGYSWEILRGSDKVIHELISDITISLSNDDYLEMPELINIVSPVELPPSVKKQYKQLQDDFTMAIGDEEVSILSASALANKLLQMGNGFIYTEEGKAITLHKEKLKVLADLIDDNPTENILVFYNFKADVTALLDAFPDGVVLDKAGKAVDAWNAGKIKLLLAQPASASMGINLQAGGRIVIWYGLNWNLEYYQQGNARLHRQGQDRPVVINHIVVKGGIDEQIINALSGKAKTQRELLAYLRQ